MDNDNRGQLDSLDFEDDFLIDEGLDGNTSPIEQPFDPDTYVKPYLGANGEPEPDLNIGQTQTEPQTQDEDDLVSLLLRNKGVQDASAIKYEAEDGTIQEVDFYSLSREEQLEILASAEAPEDTYGLSEDEIDLINDWRENNLSTSEYIDWVKAQAVQEYVQGLESQTQSYEIDTLTNDELYILDLKDNYPDLTEEELASALTHEQSNPTLYEKKMQVLRNAYRQKENERIQEDELIRQEDEARELAAFTSTVQDAVGKLDKIGEFGLEDEDREQVAEFILGTDKTGHRYFAKALDDPETLAKMAWFALEGEEALETLSNYYKQEIQERTDSAYRKGLEDGKKGITPTSRATVIRKPATPTTKEGNDIVKPLNEIYSIDLD